MYADARLMLPFSHGFAPETAAAADEKLFGRFCDDHPNEAYHLGYLAPISTISEYDLGGDLFNAPEPVIEEPLFVLDPITAAMSIISGVDDIMAETIKFAGMESIQEDPLLSDVFYECKKDLLAKSAIEDLFPELSDIKIPELQMDEVPIEQKIRSVAEGPIQRSISTGCLNSVDGVNFCTMRPHFLDFEGLDFEVAFGMRRAFSEGDVQTIGNTKAHIGNTSTVLSSTERLSTLTDRKAEERREKLSRYRKKKTKRNFGRKIKSFMLSHLKGYKNSNHRPWAGYTSPAPSPDSHMSRRKHQRPGQATRARPASNHNPSSHQETTRTAQSKHKDQAKRNRADTTQTKPNTRTSTQNNNQTKPSTRDISQQPPGVLKTSDFG